MKRVVLIHGTDGNPANHWFPWLEDKLRAEGYNVWAPPMPGNHTPNRQVYNDYLFSQDWDFRDNIIIGHSSGAVSVLNLLMDERCPRVKLGVMVGAWASGQPNGHFEAGQFDHLFPPNGFDFELIRSKADKLAYLHSDDDPYCPLEQAQYLARQTNAPMKILHRARHISRGFTEVPELWEIIEPEL